MPTFQTTQQASRVPARYGLDTVTVTRSYTIPTGFATGDNVEICTIPTGAVVTEVRLSSNAGVGATANLSVGDAASNARFISSTAYTAATLTRLNVPASHGFTYSADTVLSIFAVSIATPTVGTVVTVSVIYTMQQA